MRVIRLGKSVMVKTVVALATTMSLLPSTAVADIQQATARQVQAEMQSKKSDEKKNDTASDTSKQPVATNPTNDGAIGDSNKQTNDDDGISSVTVSFDANGGTGSLPDMTIEPFGGKPVILEEDTDGRNPLKRVGFDFVGWSTIRRLSSVTPIDGNVDEVFVPADTPLTDGEYRYVDTDIDADDTTVTPHLRKFVSNKTIELVGDGLAPGTRDEKGRRIKNASLIDHGDENGRLVLYAVWDTDQSREDPKTQQDDKTRKSVTSIIAVAGSNLVLATSKAILSFMRLLPRSIANRTYLRTSENTTMEASVARDGNDNVVAAIIEGYVNDQSPGNSTDRDATNNDADKKQ